MATHWKIAPESGSIQADEAELLPASDKLALARQAFENADVDASKAVHDLKMLAEEKHGRAGSEYVKSMVYGGMDGIVTCFALVAASAGAGLTPQVILMLGFATVLADALSMGVGDYLSEKAEHDYVRSEKKREEWELTNYEEGEKQEMVEIYEKKGMPKEDAIELIEIYSKYPALFVELMLVDELGLMPPDDTVDPRKNGLASFCSFLFFGCIPLWFYAGFVGGRYSSTIMFIVACCGTAFATFLLGAFKSRYTVQRWWISGGLMLINGTFISVAAYLTGWGLEVGFRNGP